MIYFFSIFEIHMRLRNILAAGALALGCEQQIDTPETLDIKETCEKVGEDAFRRVNAEAKIGEPFQKVLAIKEKVTKTCLGENL